MADIDDLLEYSYQKTSMPGYPESQCGDKGLVIPYQPEGGEAYLFVGLIDALGHGKIASEVSAKACEFLSIYYTLPLDSLMKNLHEHMRGTRGAVVSLVKIYPKEQYLEFVGFGDISNRIIGEDERKLLSRSGVVGYQVRTPKLDRHRFESSDTLLLCSDGIQSRVTKEVYPQITRDDPRAIVHTLMTRFNKEKDDASCIVVKYKGVRE